MSSGTKLKKWHPCKEWEEVDAIVAEKLPSRNRSRVEEITVTEDSSRKSPGKPGRGTRAVEVAS